MAARPSHPVAAPARAIPPFRERNVAAFTPHELGQWRGGHWRHERYHGRFGWWWVLGGAWYFYPEPVYPYPDYVSEDVYITAPDAGEYWYYCADPPGYYPDITSCYVPWQPIPAQPY